MREFVALAFVGCLGTFGCGVAPAGEPPVARSESELRASGRLIYDGYDIPATQCSVEGVSVHCCPSGYYMVGAHVTNNVFKCVQLVEGYGFVGPAVVDKGTQRFGMHACPLGQVMVGFHNDRNWLLCATPFTGGPPPIGYEYVDGNPATQDTYYPMHTCPGPYPPLQTSSYAMTGIRVDQNRFLCGF